MCGASAILMTEAVVCGPVWRVAASPGRKGRGPGLRVRLPVPERASGGRAGALAERNLDFRVADNAGGRVFYIMHPVLRHVAILGGGTGRRAEGPECA